jgi:hypothetical protein
MDAELVAEFHEIVRESDRNADRYITKAVLVSVPECGELISLRGNSFRVVERAWAIDEENCLSSARLIAVDGSGFLSFVYLRCVRVLP